MDSLSQSHIAALYRVSKNHGRDHLMIRIAFEHAARATEVCSLRVSQFDTSTPTVYLHLQRLKGSESTIQPLQPGTAALLLKYIADKGRDEYLFPGTNGKNAVPHISRIRFYQLFREYCQLTGIIPQHLSHPHILKHALASRVIHQVGLQHCRQFLGHVSIRSTEKYLHSDDASASAAVGAVLSGVV